MENYGRYSTQSSYLKGFLETPTLTSRGGVVRWCWDIHLHTVRILEKIWCSDAILCPKLRCPAATVSVTATTYMSTAPNWIRWKSSCSVLLILNLLSTTIGKCTTPISSEACWLWSSKKMIAHLPDHLRRKFARRTCTCKSRSSTASQYHGLMCSSTD